MSKFVYNDNIDIEDNYNEFHKTAQEAENLLSKKIYVKKENQK